MGAFDDIVGGQQTAQIAPPESNIFSDVASAPKPEEIPEKPMPGFFESLWQGANVGAQELKQSANVIASSSGAAPPEPIKEDSPAAKPFELADLIPGHGVTSKIGYQVAKGWPSIAGGVLGGYAGKLLGPEFAAAGAPIGAGVTDALQTIGPAFAEEAKRTPNDLDGAWDRAVKKAAVGGAATGLSWAVMPMGAPFINGPVKRVAFQILAAQPAIGMASRTAQNMIDDRSATEGLGQAYVQSAAGTAAPLLGHMALTSPVGNRGIGPLNTRTVAQDNIFQSAQRKFAFADMYDTQAQQPGLTTDQVYTLRTQAEMTRQEAQHETFLSNIPPQTPDRGIVKSTLIRNFMPELTSDKALQVAPRFAEYASGKGQDYDSIMHRAQQIRNPWDWVPFDDIKRWFDVYETKGAVLPPDLVQKYPFMARDMGTLKQWLNKAYYDESDVGSKASFVMEYFPHLFKRPDGVQDLFRNTMTPGTAGATWFQKSRYYDLITHALNNGLELRTTNPVDLVTTRLMSGADMRAKMNLLSDLNQAGVAVPVTQAPGQLLNSMRMPHPWQQIDAPNGTRWLLAPDVADLWQNGVVSRGLWADPGIVGRTFRGWMGLKAAWVPLKLGASLFHPIHVSLINASNNISRALWETFGKGQQTFADRMTALPQATAQSIMDMALAFPIGTPHLGKEVRAAWKQTPDTWTPRQQYLMDLYRQAGASPQLAEQMRSQGDRAMQQALVNVLGPDRAAGQRALSGAYLPVQSIKWLAAQVSKPFFEHWIPNLKAAALTREAESLLRRRPDLVSDPDKLKIALNAIGKQVDNRFGEMFYNSLFWNRTIKDSAIGSFLSLGWNLGFSREFLGGALEPAARRMMDAPTPTRALIRDVTSKSTNLLVYTMGAMTLNAMINKYFTGDDPKGLDYIFPRVGGLNTDGTARRLSTPHYTREVPMAEKNIEDQDGNAFWGLAQMLWHKMMFAPVQEAFQNKDYFGGQMYDPNAPVYKEAMQFFSHMLGEQVSPMSVTGAKRAMELSGKPTDWRSMVGAAMSGDRDIWLPFLGYGPAPAYASRSALENRIHSLGQRFVYPEERPFKENEQFKERLDAMTAYKVATLNHDTEAAKAAAQKMAELGMTSRQIRNVRPVPSAPKTFQRLGQVAPSLQVNLLRSMTPEEFKVYYPKASKKAMADPAIQALRREYMSLQP